MRFGWHFMLLQKEKDCRTFFFSRPFWLIKVTLEPRNNATGVYGLLSASVKESPHVLDFPMIDGKASVYY
jgi:hypothetical protein